VSLLRRPPSHQPRSGLLVAILLGTLALTVVLANEAHHAFASHRKTAERTLRDYADFAAWQFAVFSKENLYQALTFALSPVASVNRRPPGAPLPSSAILIPTAEKEVLCPDSSARWRRFYFRYDLRHDALETTGAPVSAEMKHFLASSVATNARKVYKRDWHYSTYFGEVGGEKRGVVYTVAFDGHGSGEAVYGFETCHAALTIPFFQMVQKYYRVLPPSLTGKVPNDSLFSIVVSYADGYELWRSSVQYPTQFAGETRMNQYFGDLIFRVSLRPATAEQLVIGGLPRSRWPFLLSLIALTTALVAVALLQLARERQLARLRSDFVSGVSHELRTPLAQIRMFAETLRLGRVRNDEERQRSLDVIDQEARRLTHLVENVLQFSRNERRTSRLQLERLELAPQIREAIENFAPLAHARGVHIRSSLEDGVCAMVDRGALRQMLLNLLDNAVKYGPPGQTVSVSLSRDGDVARIRVDDQGPGIDTAERERVWEPFTRCARDANSAVAGSGIGLAVVRELMGFHAGRAWVENAPNGGARFILELPASPVIAPAPPRNADALVTPASSVNGSHG
jgi:signal transduction histidine kinase